MGKSRRIYYISFGSIDIAATATISLYGYSRRVLKAVGGIKAPYPL
jgi:hypothetical protein